MVAQKAMAPLLLVVLSIPEHGSGRARGRNFADAEKVLQARALGGTSLCPEGALTISSLAVQFTVPLDG